MIVPMRKTYVVCRSDDHDRLLDALRELGVVHLVPVDPGKAVAMEQTVSAIDRLRRAMQVLEAYEPDGEAPEIGPDEVARETVDIQRRSIERQSRLTTLYRQIEELSSWGDVRLDQLARLREAGVEAKFVSVPVDEVDAVTAELVVPIGEPQDKRQLVAVIDRSGEAELPERAEPVPLPQRDRPAIRAEAAEIDAALKQDRARLAQLAHLTDAMQRRRAELDQQAEYTVASRGGLADGELFAIQGWVPTDRADGLAAGLADAGVDAAVQTYEAPADEEPPTQISYPRWVRPIKGLFDILGTLPGYKEMDLSPFFMIALPLFAGILIGDAGYGLLFVLGSLLFYGKLVRSAGKAKTHLLLAIGAATLIWGVLTANYFGITPQSLASAGGFVTVDEAGAKVPDFDAMRKGTGFYASVGRAMMAPAAAWIPEPTKSGPAPEGEAPAQPWNPRDLIIAISFIIGCVHLILAHLRRGLDLLPGQRTLAEVGWCVILVAMLSIIWMLFFGKKDHTASLLPVNVTLILLAVGCGLAILFGAPAKNPAKRIGIGLASALLPLLGTFSDTMSYIRLMAVGLASYYIAAAFNGLSATLADAIGWYTIVPIIVLVFGHLLNIGLAAIAIFAHGVRLNMLEFSNNAGVQWAGYAYAPFAAARDDKE